SFVAKGRHDSRSTTIVEHKNREDWRLLLARFQAVLQKRMDPTLYEYWYNDIPAGLIFEERLRDARYFIPLDFKLFVFHGNVQYIQVIGGRHATLTQRFYDRSWRPLSVGRPGLALAPVIERPKQ